MCYAIPGKVELRDKYVVVDYFGQKKRARSDFHEVSVGDYVYAQGGFIINKVPPAEAEAALETWKEMFDELQKIDLRLAEKKDNLYQIANNLRSRYSGNSSCVHGILEFSNYCDNSCLYCGLRKENPALERYRMSVEEIVEAACSAAKNFGFKAMVLQSGEDRYYDAEKLVSAVKGIMAQTPSLLIMSIGERSVETYRKLYAAGARGVLMRFETSNRALYEKFRPGCRLEDRLRLIQELKKMGYIIISGFLIGLPGQSEKDIIKDIELTNSLGVEMFSFGPLIPHESTPLNSEPVPPLEKILNTIAQTRILYPESRILVTTATETLEKNSAAQRALLSGANSLMINITPEKYQSLYYLYPGRAGSEKPLAERIDSVIKLLKSLGRAPSDLGLA